MQELNTWGGEFDYYTKSVGSESEAKLSGRGTWFAYRRIWVHIEGRWVHLNIPNALSGLGP